MFPSVPEKFLKPLSTPTPINDNRLSIPFFVRFPSVTAGAFFTGLGLGISYGGKTAGMRFRAENSHRFPTTSTGWYLYHKTKNYHIMLGGIKEGLKMGSKLAFWGGGFFVVEEAVDRLRGSKDFLSTVVAALSIAGGFSAWSMILIYYSMFSSAGLTNDVQINFQCPQLRVQHGQACTVESPLG